MGRTSQGAEAAGLECGGRASERLRRAVGGVAGKRGARNVRSVSRSRTEPCSRPAAQTRRRAATLAARKRAGKCPLQIARHPYYYRTVIAQASMPTAVQ